MVNSVAIEKMSKDVRLGTTGQWDRDACRLQVWRCVMLQKASPLRLSALQVSCEKSAVGRRVFMSRAK